MEIKNEHVEWVVVSRLGEMLKRDSDKEDEHEVTQAFALFSTICLWLRHRLGAYDSTDKWPDGLEGLHDPITSKCWGLPGERLCGKTNGIELSECSAWDFLVWVRNTMSHADHRNVTPMHAPVDVSAQRMLTGFRFGDSNCYVKLSGDDMQRIGAKFAQHFRGAFSGGPEFDDDAKKGVIEAH